MDTSTRPWKEGVEFAGYERRGGAAVALLRNEDDGKVWAYNRESLRIRQATLENGGWPHEVTAKALMYWPEDVGDA